MNKLYILATTAVVGMIITGCSNNGDDDPAMYETMTKTNALVVQKSNPDNIFVVTKNQYNYKFDSDGSVGMNMTEAAFGPLGQISFVTDNGTYMYGNAYDALGNPMAYVYQITAPTFTSHNHTYSNLSCYITNGFWDDPETSFKYQQPTATVMSYTIDNDYQVRTFPTFAVYPGLSKVYYNGSQVKTYGQLQYIVSLDIPNKKANVKLYNPDMNLSTTPQYQTLWLRNLDIEFDVRGYYIVGAGVVPQIQNGNSWTDVTEYTFDTFRMQMTGDLLTTTTVEGKTVNGYTLSLPSASYLSVTF